MIANKLALVVLLAAAAYRDGGGGSVSSTRNAHANRRAQRRPSAERQEASLRAEAAVASALEAWIHESDRRLPSADAPWREQVVARLAVAQRVRIASLAQAPDLATVQDVVAAVVRDQRRKERVLLTQFHDEGGSE